MNRKCNICMFVLISIISVLLLVMVGCIKSESKELSKGHDTSQQGERNGTGNASPEGKKWHDAHGQGERNGNGADPAWASSAQPLSLVLGCPTDRSIKINALAGESFEGYFEYGIETGQYSNKTDEVSFPAGEPVDVTIDGLQPDKQYFYRMEYHAAGQHVATESQEYSFHTQRAPGSSFIFDIQGDSHLERPQMFDSSLYAQTLKAAGADQPDFYMTIGDDFSVDTLRTVNADAVRQIYLNQRYCLSLVGQSAPLFLVNGNHEQAAECNLDGTANNVAVWAQTSRNSLFAEPSPDAFYTGDTQTMEYIGLLRDYYAWTWGDALFVVIDPYWHSPAAVDNVFGGDDRGNGSKGGGGRGGGRRGRDLWQVTLGYDQYQWLKQTLENSSAKYKFVFAHHVSGTGRGGIEEAGLYEWGGRDRNGDDLFQEKRPNWEMPIQQLMAKNGVTIFFQGHDHIFAKEELDGVVYQTLPLPADPYYALYNDNAYKGGAKLPGSGYIRVNVGPEKVTVEYVREYLPGDENSEHKSGEVAYSYSTNSRS